MKKTILVSTIALALFINSSRAQTGNTMVGGETMYPAKNIIENAVKHGIAKYSNAHNIIIKSNVIGDNLTISIFNEGEPLKFDWCVKGNSGIGLKNVYSRLVKIYDDRFSFSIHNHSLKQGVEVSIIIPVR